MGYSFYLRLSPKLTMERAISVYISSAALLARYSTAFPGIIACVKHKKGGNFIDSPYCLTLLELLPVCRLENGSFLKQYPEILTEFNASATQDFAGLRAFRIGFQNVGFDHSPKSGDSLGMTVYAYKVLRLFRSGTSQ